MHLRSVYLCFHALLLSQLWENFSSEYFSSCKSWTCTQMLAEIVVFAVSYLRMLVLRSFLINTRVPWHFGLYYFLYLASFVSYTSRINSIGNNNFVVFSSMPSALKALSFDTFIIYLEEWREGEWTPIPRKLEKRGEAEDITPQPAEEWNYHYEGKTDAIPWVCGGPFNCFKLPILQSTLRRRNVSTDKKKR